MEMEAKKTNRLNFVLPDDIMVEILRFLPFESVLACKRVSKQWYNMIKDPKFPTRYHHNGSMIVLLDKDKLFCVLIRHTNEISRYPSYTVHRIPIIGLNKKTKRHFFDHELLSGWSNGTACVKASNGYFILYNLFTGVSHTVKGAPLRLFSEFWMYYGFGYDRFDDDHKIMVACNYKAGDWFMRNEGRKIHIDKVQNKENSMFWVYSSKNECWKSFDGFPGALYRWPIFPRGGSYSFNGVLHYAIFRSKPNWVILSYDLCTHRFGEISVPTDATTIGTFGPQVTESDGRLCYAYQLFNDWSIGVQGVELFNDWFIGVQGVGGSWTKLVTHGLYNLHGLAYTALYEVGDGKKVGLFVCQSRLYWYDFSRNEIEPHVDVTSTWEKKQRETNPEEMKVHHA